MKVCRLFVLLKYIRSVNFPEQYIDKTNKYIPVPTQEYKSNFSPSYNKSKPESSSSDDDSEKNPKEKIGFLGKFKKVFDNLTKKTKRRIKKIVNSLIIIKFLKIF